MISYMQFYSIIIMEWFEYYSSCNNKNILLGVGFMKSNWSWYISQLYLAYRILLADTFNKMHAYCGVFRSTSL